MAATRTESVHEKAGGLDSQPAETVLALLADAQVEAAASVHGAVGSIARAAAAVADCLTDGGRLAYAAAGSSGLMALADALELPGTYGIRRDRIVILLAEGAASLDSFAGGPEDDAAQGGRDVEAAGLGAGDCLIAVSASGTTPYALGALDAALRLGVRTIAIANNAGAPLLTRAETAILLATPPEMIAGSTRMGAATAQKIALNMLSTLAAVRLGHVHDGHMVNFTIDNAKLQARATRVVAAVAGCAEPEASRWLQAAEGNVKRAILLAAGAPTAKAAQELLDSANQRLRPALASLEGSRHTAGFRQNRT